MRGVGSGIAGGRIEVWGCRRGFGRRTWVSISSIRGASSAEVGDALRHALEKGSFAGFGSVAGGGLVDCCCRRNGTAGHWRGSGCLEAICNDVCCEERFSWQWWLTIRFLLALLRRSLGAFSRSSHDMRVELGLALLSSMTLFRSWHLRSCICWGQFALLCWLSRRRRYGDVPKVAASTRVS